MWTELGCSADSDLTVDVNIFYGKNTCNFLGKDCLKQLRYMMKKVDELFQRDLHIRIRPRYCEYHKQENDSQLKIEKLADFINRLNYLIRNEDCHRYGEIPGMYIAGAVNVEDSAAVPGGYHLCIRKKVGYVRLTGNMDFTARLTAHEFAHLFGADHVPNPDIMQEGRKDFSTDFINRFCESGPRILRHINYYWNNN